MTKLIDSGTDLYSTCQVCEKIQPNVFWFDWRHFGMDLRSEICLSCLLNAASRCLAEGPDDYEVIKKERALVDSFISKLENSIFCNPHEYGDT